MVALAATVAAPAQADPPEDPALVERIALTDGGGGPTAAGTSGLDGSGAAASADSDRQSIQSTDGGADGPRLLMAPAEADEVFVVALTWAAGSDVSGLGFGVRVLEPSGWSEWIEIEPDAAADSDSGLDGTEAFVASAATGVQVQVTGTGDLPADLTLTLIPDEPAGEAPVRSDVGDTAAVDPDPTLEPSPDPTPSPEATPSDTPEATPSDTPEATPSDTPEATPSDTPEATPSDTPEATPSDTASPESTEPETEAIDTPSAGERSVPGRVPTDLTSVAAGGGIVPMAPVVYNSIRPRSSWGPDESLRTWDPRYADLEAAVVHHTAGSNTYTSSQVPAIIRSIYHYHAVTRDWGDIGYNVLVDRFGRAWEGRYGTLASPLGQMVIGGHARPMNTHTLGISVMGTYTNAPASSTVMNAMASVIAWAFARSGVDMAVGTGLYSTGTGEVPSGRELPRIFGHRAVAQTTCPGMMMGQIPTLTRMVQDRMPYLWYLRNDNGSGADALVRYSMPGAQAYWGDWDGDGDDTPASREGNVIYVRNFLRYGAPNFSFTFSRPGVELLVGDWDGDGVDTFAVRDGNRYAFYNDFTAAGGPDAVVYYGRPSDQALVGDWDGDGVDTLAVRRGNTLYARNHLTTGPAHLTVSYGNSSDTIYVGDWDGDGDDTVAVRRGNVYYFTNALDTRHDYTHAIARSTDLVVVGDWDGDGADTMGVRRR